MFLGIDQGTTGSTATLLNEKGQYLGSFTASVPQHFPRPGWVEHDPREILQSVEKAVRGVFRITKISPKKLISIGLTNQRETVSVFEGQKPLHRFIVWQDRRTADLCKDLKAHEHTIKNNSGLSLDPYFSASKILWLKRKLHLNRSNIKFRTIDSFLMHQLTGEDVIEKTNASRTSLMNLSSRSWDSELLSLFDIPSSWCPTLISSEGFSLKTKNCSFLPDGIPITACLGDQQAALFGQSGWSAGAGKITFGTGSFLLINTGEKLPTSSSGLLSTLAIEWKSGSPHYALEGSVFNCGSWIQWLRDQLNILKTSNESERLSLKVKTPDGVYVLPALTGLGAPFWKPEARGAIVGLTRGANKNHIARASLEAIAFQNKALVEAIESDLPQLRTSWRVDGGAVKNNLLMQIQADILGQKILRPKNLEATATGAALLSAHSSNYLSLRQIEKLWKLDKSFSPKAQKNKDLKIRYEKWKSLMQSL